MRWILLAVALLTAATASAQDAQLDALRATLVSLHSKAQAAIVDAPAFGPELTVAKHRLRDWIETQLGSLKDLDKEDENALSDHINEALKTFAANPSDGQNLWGSLEGVRFGNEGGMLIVTTGVGIPCQYDESVYGYKRVNSRWQRVWESEQNNYSPGKYAPQNIVAVHVWQAFKDGHEQGPAFVMTLGNQWGCMSTWHPVYYRAWRIDPFGSKLLIDDSEMAWLRADTYAVGSIAQDRTSNNAPPIFGKSHFSRKMPGRISNLDPTSSSSSAGVLPITLR